MEIKTLNENGKLTIILSGRLDTNTAFDLEKEVSNLDNIKELIFDLEKLEYISSAGLRILLSCQKKMNNNGSMIVKNVNDEITKIFEITGFNNIFVIK